MKLKKDSSQQKLRGAYYTPERLANAMIKLLCPQHPDKILEPSCGDGVFLESLKREGLLQDAESVTAIEIDPAEAKKVSEMFAHEENVEVLCRDFFDYYMQNKDRQNFDLIIGNPPYIRYQYLTETQRADMADILTSHGMKSNKLINAWVGFVVACSQMLSERGRIAFVIPAEILQVAYAEDLRLFLVNYFSKITLITFERLIFSEIEQEVLVFIGEKGTEDSKIRIIQMNDLSGFDTLNLHQNNFQKLDHVKEKWTKYFLSQNEIQLIQSLKKDDRFACFSEFGTINIGITTGNNSYFSIDHETEARYDLTSVLIPLIGRSAHAHGIFFTDADWRKNVEMGKKAQLLVFPNIPYEEYPTPHKNYIEYGQSMGYHLSYKCSIRDAWYIVPSIWVPDAFFLRRNDRYPKFVLNRCEAVSTDTMHRMKFHENVDGEQLLLSYYNSITFAFTELCGRSYGGGVLEILPGEMGNILIPKLAKIDPQLKNNLLEQIDHVVRKDLDIEIVLDLIDREVLINLLNINPEICSQCRVIWKKMRNRRLKRS